MLQLRFAETIGWIVDQVTIEHQVLSMSGWALAHRATPDAMQFRLNGAAFEHVEWPLPSADVAAVFSELPFARSCRFVCRQTSRSAGDFFVDGYACLSFVTPFGANQDTYRRAQFILDTALELPLPDHAQINRVIAGDVMSYRMGGATMAKRLEAYLLQRFSRPLRDFDAILDWGCGAGRLTRYLAHLCPGRVTGVDIDPDNLAWCSGAIPAAGFVAGSLQPPLPFDDGAFDLVVAISVFTHLDEETQFRWLAELRRIVRPGGVLLASIHGFAQMALYGASGDQILDIGSRGFVVLGQNSQLDGRIGDDAYYKNVAHSRDYILSEWHRYFAVLEIVEGIATNQDLVVMVRLP